MTTTTTPPSDVQRSPGHRLWPLTGLAFVLCILLGNSLTEAGNPGGALGRLDTLAESASAQLGLALELAGFVLLLGFVATVVTRCRPGVGSATAAIAGSVALAVKLGSASATLGAVRERDQLDEATAAAFLAVNDAAFVLFMIGFGLFVASAATALPLGRGWRGPGLLLGSLTVVVGVVGSVVPAAAVPVPFLLGLLWSAALGVRLVARPDVVRVGAPARIGG